GDTYNSFEHQTWVGNYVTTCSAAGENAFHLTGGAQLTNSYIQFGGNIYGPLTTLFQLDDGSALMNSTVDITPEADGVDGQRQYAFGESGMGPAKLYNACQSNLACVIVSGTVTGYLQFSHGSRWTLLHVVAPSASPNIVGVLTTTAKPSDTFSNRFIAEWSACFVAPINSIAAGMVSGTYVDSTRRGAVVIRHPPTVGGMFQIWCN
ncbi:MAG: hypothetical protein ACREJM_07105, partial [Candidatus Saccharimonadales bacterium]